MAQPAPFLPLPAPPSSHSSADIVPFTASSAVGEPLEQKLARLRSDRAAHSRKQIWTKDAHDGPYRKVNMEKEYDPLIQLPDGTERQLDLGYERVKTGPTSNFVGNHMTQGAIDLVQAQLERPATPDLPLLVAAADRAPQLLAAPEEQTAPAAPLPRPFQRYSWTDAGSAIQLELPVQQMELGGGGGTMQLTCSFGHDSLDLLVAGNAGGTDGHIVRGKASGAASYRLLVRPLHAAVVPERCSCFVRGVPALPPCSGEVASSGSGAWEPQAGCSVVTGVTGADMLIEQPGQAEQHCICFALPLSAEAVVVQLAKADERLRWEALPASLPLVPRQAGSNQTNLTALRREVRQKLRRGPAPEAPATDASTSPEQAPGSENEGIATQDPAAWHAALREAEVMMAAGRHAEALAASTACLAAPGTAPMPPAQREELARLHALRGHSHGELGGLKLAVAEYSAAIRLAQPEEGHTGGEAGLSQLLLARASLYEQQERLDVALADVLEAARLQQPPAPAVLLLAQRLRQACRLAAK